MFNKTLNSKLYTTNNVVFNNMIIHHGGDLNRINFSGLYKYLSNLKLKSNLFKTNNKLNGKLNLSIGKIHSKHNLIHSIESRLEFLNGDILVNQLLINLGKLGAADLVGEIKNENKFTNFKFENNIFLDNLKLFYNKFGVYNKEKVPANLFISGNFDLINLNMRFDEISYPEKLKEEEMIYIQKEFNNIVLENGFESMFNFIIFKEFVNLLADEKN